MKIKPNLLFLTNLYNGSEEEDIFLTQQLRRFFNVFISHPLDVAKLENKFDAALIRNIWPTKEFEKEKTALIRRLTAKGLMPRSSAEAGYFKEENYLEKEYLLYLFKQGYPVIPSVDKLAGIAKLGPQKIYFIKPKDNCDGVGSARLSLQQLKKRKLKNYLIQPRVKFDCELCFYFVDNKFVYAISTPDRLKHENYKEYKPSKVDMEFAWKFVRWNNLEYGLQRIDAVRVAGTQELLLTELEDFGPYLYLLELPKSVRVKVVNALTKSIFKMIK